MMPPSRLLMLLAAGAFLGLIGFLFLGQGPRTVGVDDGDHEAWRLPDYSPPDVAAAESVWRQRRPWGAAEDVGVGTENGATAAKAAPVPVGVIIEDGRREALFTFAGQPAQRLAEGDELPGGGRVTDITPTSVEWTGPEGRAHQRHFFASPVPTPDTEKE